MMIIRSEVIIRDDKNHADDRRAMLCKISIHSWDREVEKEEQDNLRVALMKKFQL